MGVLDILKSGYEAVAGDSSKTGGGGLTGGIFGKIMETIGLKKPEIAADALKTKEQAESKRNGLMGEFSKSLFLRQAPLMAAATDLSAQLTGNKAKEVVSWQNEFETITAVIMLMPRSWKHWFTDFFANSTWFRSLITYWPGLDGVDLTSTPLLGKYLGMLPDVIVKGGNIRQRILNDKDPDAVVGALRVMHQDIFVLGKVSADVLVKAMSGDTKAVMELLGGGAIAAAATAAIGMGSGPGSTGAPTAVEAVAAAAVGAGALKGKNLLELQKAHPELQVTTMQNKVMELLSQMKVLDTAVLIKGDWAGNNDEVTVGYTFNNGVYFLTFDEDIASSDISVRNAQGLQIYESTDLLGLNAESDAKDIIEAMQGKPSTAVPTPTPGAPTAPAATPPPVPLAAVPGPTPVPANDNSAAGAKPATTTASSAPVDQKAA